MTSLLLLNCSVLFFTIDRVESEMAIVEWAASGEITDISSALFPGQPNEGDRWVVRIHKADRGQIAYRSQSNALESEQGRLFLPHQCRLQANDHFRLEFSAQKRSLNPP